MNESLMKAKIDIWQKAKIKDIELKNRIVRSATNEHLGTLDGCIKNVEEVILLE